MFDARQSTFCITIYLKKSRGNRLIFAQLQTAEFRYKMSATHTDASRVTAMADASVARG
jgi:hypothetical protein